MKRNFEDVINELKSSPIYTMSLGSKELFHSNFWAWLMAQSETKGFVKCFFKEVGEDTEITREDKNRDIVLKTKDGKEYVIENKIKSYADQDQLERYSKRKGFVKGIITGIDKPPFKLDENKWKFIRYADIGEYLHKKILPNVKDKKLYIVLEQYCSMLVDINELIQQCLEQTEGFYDPWPTGKHKSLDHRDIRLLDVFQKLNADILYNKVFMKIKNNFKSDDFCIDIKRDYHHGKPTLDMNILYKTYKEDDRCWDKRLMLQIEGYQFRLFYRNDKAEEKDIVKDALDIKWFEEYNGKTIRGYATRMNEDHCQYSKKYIYQYFDLWSDKVSPTQDLLKHEQIEKLLTNEVNRAKEILEKHKLEFIPPFKR